ncbi:MAG: hypothetical protein HY074_16490 [Deltaproteobacteria bacterium]|nr:hypothetical protein [Deltaproteobacteria bacterium]
MSYRKFSLVLALLMVQAFGAEISDDVIDEYGRYVGSAKLRMTAAEVEKAFGKPSRITKGNDKGGHYRESLDYPDHGMFFTFCATNKVQEVFRITVRKPFNGRVPKRVHTKTGYIVPELVLGKSTAKDVNDRFSTSGFSHDGDFDTLHFSSLTFRFRGDRNNPKARFEEVRNNVIEEIAVGEEDSCDDYETP